MKELFEKFGKRTLALPGGMMGLTLVNDAAKLGLPEHLMIFAVKAALVWAALETIRDVTRWICEAFGRKPITPAAPPATPPTTS